MMMIDRNVIIMIVMMIDRDDDITVIIAGNDVDFDWIRFTIVCGIAE